jgi:Xaa-Pro aminopeptidase
VFFAYLLLTPARATLFVDGAQLSAEAKAQLGADVEVRPYGAFFEVLQGLGEALGLSADTVRIRGGVGCVVWKAEA